MFLGILGAIVYYFTIRKYTLLQILATEPRAGAALGFTFEILLLFVAIIIIPLWVVLYEIASTVPHVHVPSLVGLVVYGAIVGGLIPLIIRYLKSRKQGILDSQI